MSRSMIYLVLYNLNVGGIVGAQLRTTRQQRRLALGFDFQRTVKAQHSRMRKRAKSRSGETVQDAVYMRR